MSYTRNHFSPSTAPAEHRNLRKGDNGHFSGRKAKASRQQKPHWNHADALIRTETYQQREFGDSYQTQFEHDHPELEETNRNFKKRDVYRVTRPLNLSETEPWKSVVRSSEDSAYESADDTADEKRGKGKEVPREQLLVHQGVYVYPPGYVYEFQCGPNEALEFDVSRYKPSGWNQAMEHAGTTTMPDSEIYLAGTCIQGDPEQYLLSKLN